MQVIERVATNPDADIEKMERLYAMRERELDRIAEQQYSAAMARAQEALPVVLRESKNLQTQSKYAKEDAISKAIKPIYTKEGFSLSFDTGESPLPEHIRVICYVRHSGGYTEEKHIDYPYDLTGIKGTTNKTKIHAYKSTVSYARNTLTCMAFNVATGDDDDGNAAGGTLSEPITEEQATALHAKADEHGVLDKFMKWLSGAPMKVKSISDIRADRLELVEKALDKSIKAREKKA